MDGDDEEDKIQLDETHLEEKAKRIADAKKKAIRKVGKRRNSAMSK